MRHHTLELRGPRRFATLCLACLLASASRADAPSSTELQANGPDPYQELQSGDIAGPFVAEALRSNKSLRSLALRYQAAQASIDAAGALPNPTLQITHFVESIQTRTGPQRQAIMLQQPIPWKGKTDSKRQAAQAKALSLWHAQANEQLKIVEAVAVQVIEMADLDKKIEIASQNLELLQQMEGLVENRVKAGGDLSDLLRLQVEIERQGDTIAKHRASRTVLQAKLDGLLGREPRSDNLILTWSIPSPLAQDPDLWIQHIAESSPRLAMLQSLSESEIALSELAHLAGKPDFSVGINYIRTGDAADPSMTDSGKDPWAIMVGASLPIWGKANNSLQRQALLQKDAVDAQIEETRLDLIVQAHAYIASLEDDEARIQRYDTKILPLARQSLEITQSRYEAGGVTILDLIDSQQSLLKLETEYWDTAARVWTLRWKLAVLSGGLWLE